MTGKSPRTSAQFPGYQSVFDAGRKHAACWLVVGLADLIEGVRHA